MTFKEWLKCDEGALDRLAAVGTGMGGAIAGGAAGLALGGLPGAAAGYLGGKYLGTKAAERFFPKGAVEAMKKMKK